MRQGSGGAEGGGGDDTIGHHRLLFRGLQSAGDARAGPSVGLVASGGRTGGQEPVGPGVSAGSGAGAVMASTDLPLFICYLRTAFERLALLMLVLVRWA